MEKSRMPFCYFLISLFCCNGYSQAIFTILFFNESQVEYLRKVFTKRKFVIAGLLLFYGLKYLNSRTLNRVNAVK